MAASNYCASQHDKLIVEVGVRDAVSRYFKALHECDGELFDSIWHPGKCSACYEQEAVVGSCVGHEQARYGKRSRGMWYAPVCVCKRGRLCELCDDWD